MVRLAQTLGRTIPMDWIPALLKHLAISRSIVGAAFVTSFSLYFGPRFAPNYVDAVPKEWSFVLVGVLVFSACLLTFWSCSAFWSAAARRWKVTTELLASYELDQLEVDFLYALGQRPAEALNLDNVDYEALRLSRLEVIELVHGLEKKGLVAINPYSSNLVSLTAGGRSRALEIQRASSSAA